jgi:guanylate kinase
MNELVQYTKKGALLVVSGPSGCGKSSLLKEVYKHIDHYYFSISTTTREKRKGEINGVDYYFVSKEDFEKDIQEGNFLEYAKVHDNYYGTSLKPILKALDQSKLVIFDIDVQGHSIIRKKLNDITTSVFITTPTLDELKNRLNKRATDSKEIIQKRIENAKYEIDFINEYDYLIINDDLQVAANELVSIAKASLLKTSLIDNNVIKQLWEK